MALIFPSNLVEEGKTFPYMSISVVDSTERIVLYTPPGISFADGAGYNSMDLGAIGSSVLKGMGNASDFTSDVISSTLGAVKEQYGAADGQLFAAAAASVAANFVPGASFSSAKEVFSFANKKILNPQTNVSFTGSAIRNYTFTMKMIAESEAESSTIKKIISTLRRNMYPEEANELILKYPSKFQITFWSGDPEDGDVNGISESDHLPKIYQCYLTSLNTVYNATSNTYFSDGSPSEVDLSISFQETRALTRNDIDLLERSKIRSYKDRDAYLKNNGDR